MVSALAKLLGDKSTDGGLSSHSGKVCGKVEIDEVQMSFYLKPIADKSVLTRRPRGRIWFGRLSKSFVNRSSKVQFRSFGAFNNFYNVCCSVLVIAEYDSGVLWLQLCLEYFMNIF